MQGPAEKRAIFKQGPNSGVKTVAGIVRGGGNWQDGCGRRVLLWLAEDLTSEVPAAAWLVEPWQPW